MLNVSVYIQYDESGYEYGEPFTAKSIIVEESDEIWGKAVRIAIRGEGNSRATVILTPSLFAAVERGVQAVLDEDVVSRVELRLSDEEEVG